MNIYQSITAAMADIEPIAKGRRNQQQGFQFRGIDDIMNELQPVLKNYGLFVVPEVLSMQREERETKSKSTLLYSILTIKYTFYASDGSSVSAVVIGEGMDSGDKASNKAMAVAMKYALLQVFCIPTEDAKDPDEESHQVVTNQPQQKPAPQQQQKPAQDGKAVAEAHKKCGEIAKELGISDAEKKDINNKHGGNLFSVLAELEQMLAAQQELDTAADAAFGTKEEQIETLFSQGGN